MARAKRLTRRVVYQIKVTLKQSKPPICRRIQVSSVTTLAQLHRILQSRALVAETSVVSL
jgi:hypothetical protein